MAVNPVRQMPPAATHHGLIGALQPFQGGRVLDKSACGGFVQRIETGYLRRGDVPRLQQRDPSVARERRIGCASEVGGRSIALLPAPQPAYHNHERWHSGWCNCEFIQLSIVVAAAGPFQYRTN